MAIFAVEGEAGHAKPIRNENGGQVLSTIMGQPSTQNEVFAISGLRLFNSIPEDHDVVPLKGRVMVFDPNALHREEIVDGGLYVVENQHPVGGMSWETYDRFNQTSEPRVRIKTSRRVVRTVRRENVPNQWWQVLPSGYHDGPFPDWSVTLNMVGKVVGIYIPTNDGDVS